MHLSISLCPIVVVVLYSKCIGLSTGCVLQLQSHSVLPVGTCASAVRRYQMLAKRSRADLSWCVLCVSALPPHRLLPSQLHPLVSAHSLFPQLLAGSRLKLQTGVQGSTTTILFRPPTPMPRPACHTSVTCVADWLEPWGAHA